MNLSAPKRQELTELFALNRKVFKAHLLKESLDWRRTYRYEGAMLNYLQRWIDQLRWPRLKPFQKLAEMLVNHLDGILNYCRTKVPLGVVEAINGKMAMLKMSDVFQSVNDSTKLDTLTVALSHTLDGMKTAFGCRLAGLLGALVLSSGKHLLRRRQAVLVQEMEEWISCELTPMMEQVDPEADEAARAFATVLKDATGNMKGFSVALMCAAETYKADSSQMETLVTGFGDAMENFALSANEITSNRIAVTQTLKETQATIT